MTNAERLRHPCPRCHAKAGDPCTDPLGEVTPRCHQTRGPGALASHKAKEADRINARARASYGPLFAGLAEAEVKPVTAADLIERDRRGAALAFDAPSGPAGLALQRQCNKGLEWLYVRHLARELERLAGDVGRVFAEHAIAAYPTDYLRMIFAGFLTTTEAKEIGPYRVPADNRLGFILAYRHKWAPAVPLMSREEFDRRYPGPDHWRGLADAPEPDDGGLFAGVMTAIRAAV